MSSVTLEPNIPYEKPILEKALILAGVVVPLLATLYAMVLLWQRYFSWLDLALLVSFYVATGFGVTIGFHRLLTHRSFETNPVIKAIFIILGCMALQGNPISWASTHIEHHAKADSEGDPHSPLEGLWHAHMGWAFDYKPDLNKYGTWLTKDPLIVFIDRFWFVWFVLGLAIPFAIGGWTGFLWGGLVRVFLMQHSTGSVNSICHTFGARPYSTPDVSRNNLWVGFIALGEGWHNNHHAFPRSAFHGLKWWQFDFSAYFIRALEALGLVWNVQRVTVEQERKRAVVPIID
jgi:stearoyl-CoA desaturase (Delta-9 desaturase)